MARNFLIAAAALLLLHGSALAVDYSVSITNKAAGTPGAARFRSEVGLDYSRQTLATATNFIWNIFRQRNPADRKNVPKVSLIVDDIDGVAFASNNEIHLSARYVQRLSGDVRREITGVLYHEMVHVWQWSGGNARAPGGLTEGIADFVRLRARLGPAHWVKPGQGDRWDQGYDVTARFLDYCEGLRGGFVAELNKRIRNGYDVNYFVQLLGKTPDQLWRDYKAKYGM